MKLRETHKHFKTLIFMTDLSMNQVIYNLWKQFSKASTVLCNRYYMIKEMYWYIALMAGIEQDRLVA